MKFKTHTEQRTKKLHGPLRPTRLDQLQAQEAAQKADHSANPEHRRKSVIEVVSETIPSELKPEDKVVMPYQAPYQQLTSTHKRAQGKEDVVGLYQHVLTEERGKGVGQANGVPTPDESRNIRRGPRTAIRFTQAEARPDIAPKPTSVRLGIVLLLASSRHSSSPGSAGPPG